MGNASSRVEVMLAGGRGAAIAPEAYLLAFDNNPNPLLWPNCTWKAKIITASSDVDTPIANAGALINIKVAEVGPHLLAFGGCLTLTGGFLWNSKCPIKSNNVTLGHLYMANDHIRWYAVANTGHPLPELDFAAMHVMNGMLVIMGGFPDNTRPKGSHRNTSRMSTDSFIAPVGQLGSSSPSLNWTKLSSAQTGMPAFYGRMSSSLALVDGLEVLIVAAVVYSESPKV
jgi:hypothetical protein